MWGTVPPPAPVRPVNPRPPPSSIPKETPQPLSFWEECALETTQTRVDKEEKGKLNKPVKNKQEVCVERASHAGHCPINLVNIC